MRILVSLSALLLSGLLLSGCDLGPIPGRACFSSSECNTEENVEQADSDDTDPPTLPAPGVPHQCVPSSGGGAICVPMPFRRERVECNVDPSICSRGTFPVEVFCGVEGFCECAPTVSCASWNKFMCTCAPEDA